ncbi:helix-turn-helix domain-containing protein [Pseudomonas juntendi]|uniref:helix-turn-helix domain-containing protein n=1 Tax=Pseudomonas juntendi TaxID=2666183 RepID=UPI00244B783D|nr:S24 family peptidase [Pseudomonas juntendi]MDG9891230.1 helix-turn-helix domain-containing protein [Pseudomonas juntendi]
MLGERHTFLQDQRAAFIFAAMELKDRLKQARKHAKLSQVQLAERAGIAQASISEIERGLTRTSGHLVKFATICGVSPIWLSEGTGSMLASEQSNVAPGPPILSATRRIEIVGTAQLGNDGYWAGLDVAEGWVETWSRDEDAYALRLKGDSMAPAIRSGWIAVCEPNHRLVPGEYVMVTTVDGQSMVKELLFENDEGVNLASVNAAYGERRVIAWADIEKIHYVGNILAPSKVLGRF